MPKLEWSAALIATLSIVSGAEPTWSVTQSSELRVILSGQIEPVAAANAAGEFFYAIPPTIAQPTPPDRQYGDVSNGGIYIYKLDESGRRIFSVVLGGQFESRARPRLAPDLKGGLYVAGQAPETALPMTDRAYAPTPEGERPNYLCRLDATGVLEFCTYLNTNGLSLASMLIDADGDVYVAGAQPEPALGVAPTPGALSLGKRSIAVLKFNASVTKLVYAAAFGSSGVDVLSNVAVGNDGSVYLGGLSLSNDFPLTADAAISAAPLGAGAFLSVLNPTGTALTYSSYGWYGEDTVAMAVDPQSNLYTASRERDGSLVVRKYRGTGPRIVYEKSFTGGATGFNPLGLYSPTLLSVDDRGVLNVVATARAANFPLHNPGQTCHGGNSSASPDGYLIRLVPDGTWMESTYLIDSGHSLPLTLAATSTEIRIGADIFSSVNRLTSFAIMQLTPATNPVALTFACWGNAASLTTRSVVPGEIVSLFGEGIGLVEGIVWQSATPQLIGTTLGGTEVTFDGIPALVLYAQASQVNVVAPQALGGRSSTNVCLRVNGIPTNCIVTDVGPADPAIFVQSSGDPIALNADGASNTPLDPAPIGSVVSIFATGLGVGNQVQVKLANSDGSTSDARVLYMGPATNAMDGLVRIDFRAVQSAVEIAVIAPDGSEFDSSFLRIATVIQ